MAANGLELYAEDVYGNSVAVPKKAIVIEQISRPELFARLFYYNVVARYWYLFLVGIIILVIGTEPAWHKKYLKKRLKNLYNAEKINIETQKDIQRKYFKHRSISRDNYEKLILKYRENISAMKERKLEVQEKLGKRKFGFGRITREKKRS